MGDQGPNDVWTVPGEAALRDEWERADCQSDGPSFHQRQIQDFLQAARDGRPPLVTAEEGRKSLEIILAIYESSRTGMPVRLPLKTDQAQPL